MSEKLKVYVVEDDPLIQETIKVALEKEGVDVIGYSDNAGDALFELDDLSPDLILLDITIEGKQSGIDLGDKISKRYGFPFIYLTSHSDSETLQRALKTKPAAYLLKPFRQKDLKVAIDKAMYDNLEVEQKERSSHAEHIFVKQNKQWVKLSIQDILFAKADDNYTEIHTESERFMISQPLKKVLQNLSNNSLIRVQRSYIVNVNHISKIDEDILVIGNELIPVGKKYRKDLMNKLNFL